MPPVATTRRIIVALSRQTGDGIQYLRSLPVSELLEWWATCAELMRESNE